MASSIFSRNDFRGGLLPNADALMQTALAERPLPSKQSLICLVLHAHDFAPGDDWASAESILLTTLGMTGAELAAISSQAVLGPPLLGNEEWSVDGLPGALAPPGAVQIVPPPAGGGADDQDLAVVVDARTERMLRRAIQNYQCVLLVGPPGTGKGRLVSWLLQLVSDDPAALGFEPDLNPNPMWRTPDESWSAFDMIGGLAPDDDGHLRWSHGLLINALIEQRWLILDETNRADMDKIMGPLLTWLARQEVEVGRTAPHNGVPIHVGWADGAESVTEDPGGTGDPTRFLAGGDWRLLGTYNPQDAQRVFRFGLALSRRFVVVPVPALNPGQFDELLRSKHPGLAEDAYLAISALYSAHRSTEESTLGPAVFLRMALYLGGEGEPADGGPDVTDLVAEAYVVSVGKYLAAYDDHMLQELGSRVVTEESALSQAQWDWVISQRAVLG